MSHSDSLNATISLPANYFEQNVFCNKLTERREYEQFFWTKETVLNLMKSIGTFEVYSGTECCCLTTPSLAHAFHESDQERVLLDIDDRFDYLPRFHYFDVRKPEYIENERTGEQFRLIVLDPPFFFVPIEQFRVAVDKLTNGDTSTKILIGFLKREEKRLLSAFKDYNLQRTNFELWYSAIKPNKCRNFALYSNIDLPGIKRIKHH